MRLLALMSCAGMLLASTGVASQPTSSTANLASNSNLSTSNVDPASVLALRRMSKYLTSLKTFKLIAESSLDVVTVDGQRLQMDATINYKVMRPGIWIDYESDQKTRQFIFDGKQFTIYSPRLGFYATVPAPATNQEFLRALYDRTGIKLPLEDLFRWSDGDESDIAALTSGFNAGTAKIDGVSTDHWAFRAGEYDWELWIEQGERPVPRKIVIIDRTDPTLPAYTARLTWVLNPPLTASEFAFVAGKDTKRIQAAQFTPEDKQ